MISWSIISIVLCLVYAVFLLYLSFGWKCSAKLQKHAMTSDASEVSVIIPCRNEAANITNCLDSIAAVVTDSAIQIIVVNDHSEDDTVQLVTAWISAHTHINITLIHLEETTGKKAALTSGIEQAAYDIILTTDADCVYGSHWIQAMKIQFSSENLVALCGPVRLQGEGLFAALQIIESAGLVAMGAATLALGKATTCNGANFMFSRQAYRSAGGYGPHGDLASGDDEFLMHVLHRQFPGRVKFCHNAEALVYTHTIKYFNGFMQQRIRWASKSTHYNERNINALQAILPLLLIVLLCNAILGFWHLFLLLLLIKCTADMVYFFCIRRFFGIGRLWKYNWLITLYQFYCIPVVVRSIDGSYTWKDRRTH